jgi:hypothetical protein
MTLYGLGVMSMAPIFVLANWEGSALLFLDEDG